VRSPHLPVTRERLSALQYKLFNNFRLTEWLETDQPYNGLSMQPCLYNNVISGLQDETFLLPGQPIGRWARRLLSKHAITGRYPIQLKFRLLIMTQNSPAETRISVWQFFWDLTSISSTFSSFIWETACLVCMSASFWVKLNNSNHIVPIVNHLKVTVEAVFFSLNCVSWLPIKIRFWNTTHQLWKKLTLNS